MDGDPLSQGFMDRLSECIIQMGFPAENQGEIIHRVIAVIHKHLDVIQDSCIQILRFINCQKQRLSFLFIEVCDLLLDGFEHDGLTAFIGNPEYGTELFVEICNTDCGQTQVLHVEKAWVQAFGKTSEAVGFSHPGACRKHTDATDILEIVQTAGHLREVFGNEMICFFQLLFVKRVE